MGEVCASCMGEGFVHVCDDFHRPCPDCAGAVDIHADGFREGVRAAIAALYLNAGDLLEAGLRDASDDVRYAADVAEAAREGAASRA